MPAIAAPPYRGTLFINDTQDDEGWSENYWVAGNSYAAAASNLLQIWQSRQLTLTSEMELFEGRISATNIRGDTYLLSLQGVGVAGSFPIPKPAGIPGSLPSGDCVFMRLQSNDAIPYHTVQPIHGIPKSGILSGSDAELDITNFYYAALQQFGVNIRPLIKMVTQTRAAPPGTFAARDVQAISFPIQVRSRKVGRPFGLLRGRRVLR